MCVIGRPSRPFIVFVALMVLMDLAYLLWSPGKVVLDGRHDLQRNGIWLQHGWLGDDEWFTRYEKDPSLFRDDQAMDKLAELLAQHSVKYVFPHVCPCRGDGCVGRLRLYLGECKCA